MLIFDKKPAAEQPWTQQLWVYDFRTNIHFTLKQNPLRRADLDEFVASYLPGKDRGERVEHGRWMAFTHDELVARDKANLDITWLRDESLQPGPPHPRPRELGDMTDAFETACSRWSPPTARTT